jgi:hypothetical protein
MDAVRRMFDHLRAFNAGKKLPRIDLFLHSNGGDGIVPWRLVTLVREYTDEFCVLVPYRAFSAATLTALGAHEIVMHPMGMLGPTDPTVGNPFNPVDPNTGRKIGISVEDVTAYFALVKEDAGIQHEDQLVQAVLKLADNIHPLALGNVKRSLSQSRMMARKLLALHMDAGKDEHKIHEIVSNLTSKLFYHGHPINRTEARKQLGLENVESPPPLVEKTMWQLYLDYEKEMQMEEAFSPPFEFVAQFPKLDPGKSAITDPRKSKVACIESTVRTDMYCLEYQISGTKQPDGSTKVNMIVLNQSWGKE